MSVIEEEERHRGGSTKAPSLPTLYEAAWALAVRRVEQLLEEGADAVGTTSTEFALRAA